MTTHAATSGTTREDTMSTRHTPEEMAADRLEVARRKRVTGEARVARAEAEVRSAKAALRPLLDAERYAAAHPLLADAAAGEVDQ